MLIEQVVFAWSDAEGRPAARVLGRTANIHPADLKELAAWGPEHGATLSKKPGAISYECHPLASGAFCVGRTGVYCLPTRGRQRAGDERSLALYTHCLLIAPDDALRHARHFPLILRAAENDGAFRRGAEPAEKMEPLLLDHFNIAGPSGGDPFAAPNAAAMRQAHAAHRETSGADNALPADQASAAPRASRSPLDAAFDAALQGRGTAIGELATLWTAAERDSDASAIDESRERYLRRAASVWTDYLNDAHDAGQSLASIEVLCLLLDV